MNPDYFKGTVVETGAEKLAARLPKRTLSATPNVRLETFARRFSAGPSGNGTGMKSFASTLQRLGAGVVLAGLAFSASAGTASAQWYHGPPPPPPRFEHHPMRSGYVWENGHWARIHGRWAWVAGRYVMVAPGRHWIAGHWRMGPQGRYWVGGHWS
jgi:hypothetical protein